jgi:hypothetical protein
MSSCSTAKVKRKAFRLIKKENIVENTTVHVFVIQGKRTEVFFRT